ncbi:hypothetical protein SCHPADRAFT_224398 [Schizopora paradoxa]|uniref:Uncharacterized protein n=1 Tax=Schizopora paradoxa TaxID=27342 RepID=A0A0H2S348_9AGAM|nr:hypothetical protein SCHPADRAFT_224398 [Schizopora paradoxa]
MTHVSPTAFCTWSVLSCALFLFLVCHLWRYDRFACLKWSSTPYNGAFKRLMTYTYLISIPMIGAFSVGFTWMKYKAGYMKVLGFGYIPTPYVFWPQAYQDAIFPLMLVFSFAWSLEMITHLEELCFWLFLVRSGPSQHDWFKSRYSKLWMGGSVVALVYVPLLAILNRSNPYKCEARTFLAGSAGDFALTVAFLPILWNFPTFLDKLKGERVDEAVIIRLQKFYELNIIRVIFRCFMFIPLFILGMDGVIGHKHSINESLFWTDLLATLAAFGCAFSSVCTILIFFPRSYEAEYRANNSGPPSECLPSPLWKNTNLSDHADSLQYHHQLHQTTPTQLRSKSKSTLASMAKELKRTPVKRVLSRISVRMPLPQALRRKTSQLTIASDVHPFNYPNDDLSTVASPPLNAERSGNRTYLLTDSPILEAAKEQQENDDVELFVLDGVGSDGAAEVGVVFSGAKRTKQHRERTRHSKHRERKAGTSSPPPPRYDAGPSSPPKARLGGADGWSKRKGLNHEFVRVEAPRFVDPDAILSIPHMPYSHSPSDSAAASNLVSSDAASSPSPQRGDEKHMHRGNHPRAYPFAGDGSGSRHRRSHVSQTAACTCASSSLSRLTAANVKEHNHRMSKLNPLILSFSSPLDVAGRDTLPKASQRAWV